MNNTAAKLVHDKFMSDAQKLKEARAIYRKRMKKKYDAENYDEFKILQVRKRARIKAGLNIEFEGKFKTGPKPENVPQQSPVIAPPQKA